MITNVYIMFTGNVCEIEVSSWGPIREGISLMPCTVCVLIYINVCVMFAENVGATRSQCLRTWKELYQHKFTYHGVSSLL